MKRKKDYKYLRPVTRWSRLESEGIICLSATVKVDELANENVDAETGSYKDNDLI